ncbi:hypothetical protein CASFOL_015961 [Castilleja foliolosa]|uniref:TFIIS N-terminal domain-containing protein n=1 Tax=Castilleja foliolosa TaxID=1961234 RepID=A0ABD3DF84_9LAMI
MTLDDFFTLTEMNNGLTSPSRVNELISVMQIEKDSIAKNASDSTRQRSAVASTIAATKNKDCLDLFLQLDGLHFISSWLKDAQKLSKDTADTVVEELIAHLLQVVENMHVDYEKAVASEILTAVENLIDHNSSKVQDKAQVLLESWKASEKPVSVTDDVARDNGLTEDEIEIAEELNKILDSPVEDERPIDRVSSPSSPKLAVDPTVTDVAVAETEAVTELSSEKKSCEEGSSAVDSMRAVDSGVENQSGNSNKEGGGDINGQILPKPFSSEKTWGKFLSGIKDDVSDGDGDLKNNNYSFGKNHMDRESDQAGKKPDVEIDYQAGKKPDVEIDYGIVDPLEVARLVAMEVEREVVDYKEHSCSSSEKKELPETNKRQLDSPGSVSGKKSLASDELENDSNSNSSNDDSETSSENLDANGTQDVANSQVPEVAAQEEEKEPKTEKRPHNFFDLNEEFFSEDQDRSNQFPTHVSVVSASRASAADPKLPCAPLQFEGNLGWKGSALTSAFRPASPRRVPESDFSSGSSSKQRQVGFCLDFDLNVTESVDESSLETNSKRSEHLELDLNCASEDGGGSHLLDWRTGNLFQSSSNNPPIRNKIVDLNNQPSLFLNNNANKASQSFNITGNGINYNSNDDSAISIMGTRVEIDRKDLVSQTPSFQNGRTMEPSFDYSLGRTGNFVGIGSTIPYSHYGYNNIAHGPVMPFSGPMYGPGHPIPYMVDSRGAPVIPQMMGSASSLPAGFSQPPFVINMNGPINPNGVGPSRGSFNLNSGMVMESGSKDPSGLGLFLNSAQARPVDQPNPQAAMSSAVGGKRKEPENGYNDNYYPYKHFTPPWKQS